MLRIKWHTFHARILPYIYVHTHTHTPTHTHSRGRVQSSQYLVRIGSNGGASRNADILDYKIKHVRRNTARLVCERKKKKKKNFKPEIESERVRERERKRKGDGKCERNYERKSKKE